MAPDEPPHPDDVPAVDDAVAGLIDDKPSRPKLSVVPPLAEAVAAARPKPASDDPLAAVLDPPPAPPPEPEVVTDAFAEGKPLSIDVPDLSKLLDLNALSSGLRQLASWIDKQIPAFQETVSQFLTTVEKSIVITSDGIQVKPAASADAAATDAAAKAEPILVSVPADADAAPSTGAHDAPPAVESHDAPPGAETHDAPPADSHDAAPKSPPETD